ncbi:hypothetical protein D623_10021096 [Myotis brandtii]|uniref:Uncharacterized protein n=1 Tax=Myotis brandtii TaxID=109478 RepID=S7NE93_MYOBR|nr:hypothetical protein D623_10021096 [Myotis brandtii]
MLPKAEAPPQDTSPAPEAPFPPWLSEMLTALLQQLLRAAQSILKYRIGSGGGCITFLLLQRLCLPHTFPSIHSSSSPEAQQSQGNEASSLGTSSQHPQQLIS